MREKCSWWVFAEAICHSDYWAMVLTPRQQGARGASHAGMSRWPPCSCQKSAGSAPGPLTFPSPHSAKYKYSYFFFASSSFPPGSKYPFPYSPMSHPQTFPLLNYFILSCLILVYLGWNPNLTEVSGKTPIDSNGARISSFVLIRLWVCLPWIYLILSWFDCSFWMKATLHLCALSSV